MATNKEQEPKSNRTPSWGTSLSIALIVVLVWGLSWYLIDRYVVSSKIDQPIEVARGVFGDKFGAVNALFSGLAFAGIIFTILLQRRELSLQRKDIEEQNETLRQQRFENSFFHLLALHGSIVENLRLAAHSQRDAVVYFTELLKITNKEFAAFQPLSRLPRADLHTLRATPVLTGPMKTHLGPDEVSAIEAMLENNPGLIGNYLDPDQIYHLGILKEAYLSAHEKSQDALSHYFRNLYHVFRFIDESTLIDEIEKTKYARITRAQLSDRELVAILYNSLATGKSINGSTHEFGYPKMTRLIQKYDILQNLNQKSVIHPIHLDLIKSANLEAL